MTSPISMVTVEYQCADGEREQNLGARLGNDKEFAEKLMHTLLVEKGLEPELDARLSTDGTAMAPVIAQPAVPAVSQRIFKWTDESIRVLVALVGERKAYQPPVQKRKRRQMWESITTAMIEKGYSVTWDIVHKKWFNLQDTYKRIVERQFKTGDDDVAWQYYEAFDAMLGDTFRQQLTTELGPSTTSSSASIPSSSCQFSDKEIGNSERNQCSNLTPKPSATLSTLTLKRTALRQRKCQKKKSRRLKEKSAKQAIVTSPAPQAQSAAECPAPSWFVDYCERKEKSEKEWRDEFKIIMAERTSSIRELTHAISGLIQSQNNK